MCEAVLSQATETASKMDSTTALTLVLAGLTALLTVLAIIIAVAAVWGFLGIRDSVKEMATKRVDEAIEQALKKYPDSADMLKVLERLRSTAEFWDQMRNQAVTAPEPKSVAIASQPTVQGVPLEVEVAVEPETPLESSKEQTTPIEQYPGEEEASDDGDGKTPK